MLNSRLSYFSDMEIFMQVNYFNALCSNKIKKYKNFRFRNLIRQQLRATANT